MYAVARARPCAVRLPPLCVSATEDGCLYLGRGGCTGADRGAEWN